jgi:hypothetical protein
MAVVCAYKIRKEGERKGTHILLLPISWIMDNLNSGFNSYGFPGAPPFGMPDLGQVSYKLDGSISNQN